MQLQLKCSSIEIVRGRNICRGRNVGGVRNVPERETFLRLQARAVGKFECGNFLSSFHFDARNSQKSFPATPDNELTREFVGREEDLTNRKFYFQRIRRRLAGQVADCAFEAGV